MNVQTKTNQDEENGLIYNHDEARVWQQSSLHSMGIWSV